MTVSIKLIKLLMYFEAFRGKAYLPTKDDVWTIGYGETKGVKEGDTMSEPYARQLLTKRLEEFQNELKPLIKVPLTENQLSAVTSLVYNIGITAFKKSQALKSLNAGDFKSFKRQAFSPEIGFVKQKGKILKGLVNRRQMEKELFES